MEVILAHNHIQPMWKSLGPQVGLGIVRVGGCGAWWLRGVRAAKA